MNHSFGSGWGSLLWKEWRQQRLAALLLGLFCLLGYMGYCRFMGGDAEPTGWVLLLVLASACLGASVFAGEHDDGTGEFMDRLPMSKWGVLAVKYTLAMVLVAACLLLASILKRPDLANAFEATELAAAWQSAKPPLSVVLCASAVIAIAGALAGSGLGAMGTLLVTGGITAVCAILFNEVCRTLSQLTTNHESGIRLGVLVAWFLPHVWLVFAWCRRTSRRNAWHLAGWGVAVVLAPAMCLSCVQIGEQLVMSPADAANTASLTAIPSPDGHTVALTAQYHVRFGTLPKYPKSWLLDVDTGKSRQIGSWWRDNRFAAWSGDNACWSPDGRWVRLVSASVFLRPELPYEAWSARVQERVWRVGRDNTRPVRSWEGPGSACARWLGNGLMTTYSGDAWEFRDLASGTVKRCLHPPEDVSLDRQWSEVQKIWLDHEIASIHVEEAKETGGRVCRYWRTAPELPCTERRDLVLPEGMPSGDLYPTPSMDGKWVFLSTTLHGGGGAWLLSLADGICSSLGTLPETLRANPSFTPDSSLLVVPGLDSLDVWNVAARQWESRIELPPVTLPDKLSPRQLDSIAAISPAPPWRVALSIESSGSVHVADLAERSVSEVFSTPLPEGYNFWFMTRLRGGG